MSLPPQPVVSETYDEIVFVDPTPAMAKLLALPADLDAIRKHDPAAVAAAAGTPEPDEAAKREMLAKYNVETAPTGLEEFYTAFDAKADLHAIASGQAFVDREIEVLQERLLRAQAEKRSLESTVSALGGGDPDF